MQIGYFALIQTDGRSSAGVILKIRRAHDKAWPSDSNVPLVIRLHGYGASTQNLEPLGIELQNEVPDVGPLRVWLPEGPHASDPGHHWGQDREELFSSASQVVGLVQEAVDSGTPSSAITLVGFSQGWPHAPDGGRSS